MLIKVKNVIDEEDENHVVVFAAFGDEVGTPADEPLSVQQFEAERRGDDAPAEEVYVAAGGGAGAVPIPPRPDEAMPDHDGLYDHDVHKDCRLKSF